jgi:cytidylate kinase
MIITIDGPTASGKSTIAAELAKKLHFYFLSSGILYRALAYLLIKDGHSIGSFAHLKEKDLAPYFTEKFSYSYSPEKGSIVLFNNEDITSHLKTKNIDTASSIIALNPIARQILLSLQHIIAHNYDIIVEGRDTGSVVFPNADLKFFITADAHERAKRWQKDQEKKGNKFTLDQALKEIQERDYRDQHRAIAPLIIPKGAIIVDTTNLSIEKIVHEMSAVIKKKKGD